ncbi:MAG: Caspase domain protein [Betaproteobacteria bacterium ADurb.Bin341]|nr:MAG: Caspase domain protein [Betaproteobacteria bacterium ADurb.Bin341]
MRHIITLILLCGLGCAQAAEGHGTRSAEKRYALVIGNAAYKTSPLSNPVNDASDVAAKLRALGFEVILKTNTTLREMSRAITQFGERLDPGSVALFYYAGHGIQAKGRNYLIPVDAEIASEAAVRSEAVDVDQLLEQLAPASVSMVILDACRNNPYERRFRGGRGSGLAQIDAPKGTLIAYATAPGKVAADGEGRNGLYTAQLLQALDQPGVKVEDVFKQVRIKVAQASRDQQIPWEASSLTGDFFFVFTGPTTVNVQPAERLKLDPETEAWKAAESANRAEAIEAYLKAYPKGKFAAAAGIKLSSLRAEQQPAVKPAPSLPVRTESSEDALWLAVEKGNSAEDYGAYLAQYPKGKYAVLAKGRKAKLEQAAQNAQLAENSAWASAEGANTRESYAAYLQAYPQGQYAALARARQAALSRQDQIETGARILGQWGDGRWYPATISSQNGDFFHVAFDDGDQANLPRTRIRGIDWKLGTRVQCNWKGRGRYYTGTITVKEGNFVHISYDDGDQEDTSIGRCRSQ